MPSRRPSKQTAPKPSADTHTNRRPNAGAKQLEKRGKREKQSMERDVYVCQSRNLRDCCLSMSLLHCCSRAGPAVLLLSRLLLPQATSGGWCCHMLQSQKTLPTRAALLLLLLLPVLCSAADRQLIYIEMPSKTIVGRAKHQISDPAAAAPIDQVAQVVDFQGVEPSK